MNKKIAQLAFICLMVSGYSSGVMATDDRVPPVLKEGGNYTFFFPLVGKTDFKVLRIDRISGWVQVASNKGRGKEINGGWINTAQAIAIIKK